MWFGFLRQKIYIISVQVYFSSSLKLWEDCWWDNDRCSQMKVAGSAISFFLNIFMSKSITSTFILTLRVINPPMNFWQLKEGQIQLRPENFFVKLMPEVANGILWRATGDKTWGNLIKALYNKIITITAPRQRHSHSQCCKFKLASCQAFNLRHCLVKAHKRADLYD